LGFQFALHAWLWNDCNGRFIIVVLKNGRGILIFVFMRNGVLFKDVLRRELVA
jgi:hypothetical protein